MTLSDLEKNHIFKIVEIKEDSCPTMRDRLSSMNINKGSVGQVLNKGWFGPIEIEVDGAKVGIGRKMASKIEVKLMECPILK